MDCCIHFKSSGMHWEGCWNHPAYVEPLAPWEEELLYGRPTADVTFFVKDGSSFTIQDINFDSISAVGANKGVVCVEGGSDPDKIYHVPNVLYWTITHNV